MNFKFKRTLSIVLTLLLMFSCCVPAFAVGKSGDSLVDRDTVLLLDNSVSMYGDPLEYTKQAAIKFCKQLFEASNSSRVAIVVYDTNVVTKTNFTTDINYLTNIINSMDGNGSWTNIYSAVVQADKLLQQESDASIKNMVIMTDGVPTAGEYTDAGPYTYQDYSGTSNAPHYVYQYANALYNGVISLHSDYNVYTLGFFHNMYEDQKAFASRVLNDIQNTKYYDVTDADDLEFTFGEVAEDIVGNDYPIIVVPGVMGSQLYLSSTDFSESNKVWAPDYENWKGLDYAQIIGFGKRMAVNKVLYVKPPEDQDKLDKKEREYGAQNAYKALIDDLCETYDREVYFFSYDWRNSNISSAEKLNDFIKTLKADKVDLICHSMGGLVGSCYVGAYGTERIDKIITCGTPYEGAPKMINVIQNWDLLDDNKEQSINFNDVADTALGIFGGLTKSVKKEFPAIAELLPTTDYVDVVPMYRDSAKLFNKGDYQITTDKYVEIVKKIVGETNYKNAKVTHDFITSDKGNYGVLADFENAYFIVGTGKATISSIKFQWLNSDIDEILYETDVKYSMKGDGTVPFASATMAEYLKDKNNTIVLDDTDHGETASSEEARTIIKDIIDGKDVENGTIKEKSYIVIRIACPVDVSVQLNGEKLSSDIEDMTTESSFGCFDLLGENNEIKVFCLEENDDYLIDINGTDIGTMDYEIRWFNESDELIDNITFTDVPITEDTLITTNTDNETEIVLNVDNDGDGEADEVIEADEQETGRFDDTIKKIKKIFEMIIEIIQVIMNIVSTAKGE